MQEYCKSCKSRQELSNQYLLAKIGVDTAENEPLKVWRKIQFMIHSPPYQGLGEPGDLVEAIRRGRRRLHPRERRDHRLGARLGGERKADGPDLLVFFRRGRLLAQRG